MAQGIITAEGDNQMMLMKVGKQRAVEGPEELCLKSFGTNTCLDSAEVGNWVDCFSREQGLRISELRLKFASASKKGPLDRWNSLVCDVVDLGQCHGEGLTARALAAGLSDLGDPLERERLSRLFEFWALARIQENAAWAFARGLLTQEESIQIEERRAELIVEIEPEIEALVTGLSVPASDLSGPLVSED